MIPQIIYLSILFIGLLLAANLHGKPKEGEYNFWTTFLSYIIILTLLFYGGFFDVFFK